MALAPVYVKSAGSWVQAGDFSLNEAVWVKDAGVWQVATATGNQNAPLDMFYKLAGFGWVRLSQ